MDDPSPDASSVQPTSEIPKSTTMEKSSTSNDLGSPAVMKFSKSTKCTGRRGCKAEIEDPEIPFGSDWDYSLGPEGAIVGFGTIIPSGRSSRGGRGV